MPDIFDQIAEPAQAGDIFEQLAPEQQGPQPEPFTVLPSLEQTPPARSSEELAARNYYERVKAGIGSADVPETQKEFWMNPLVTLPKGELPPLPPGQQWPTGVKVAAGAYNVGAGAVESMTSRAALASMGVAGMSQAAGRVVAGAWSLYMATHFPDLYKQLKSAFESGDAQKITEAVGNTAATAVFTAAGAKHAISPARPTVVTVPEVADAKAPQTAEALAQTKTLETTVTEPSVKEVAPVSTETSQAISTAPEVSPAEAQPVLGITPPETGLAGKLIEYFKPPPNEPVPDMVIDTGTPLPDLQPKEVANAVFSKPFAAERIPVIGRLMGGRARIRTPQDQAVAAWFAERNGVGPAIASSVGQDLGGRVNEVFKTDAEGNLNVIPKREGASLKISDVFEHLEDYDLSPEQQRIFDEKISPVLERQKELSQQYDLLETEGREDYFPRTVTERPPEKAGATLAGGRRVGAKQFFQKERAFTTEAEGWEKGYKYETDVEKRLVTGTERLYRAIADKRLATDPVLGGKTRSELVSELTEAYSEELGAGTMTEAKIDRIASGIQTVGTVWQPGFFGKIFDAETANMLNREFGREQSSIRRTIANANDFVKALSLGFDLGVGQIQLLPTLFRNPGIWSKSVAKSIGVMFDPKVWQAYSDQNIQAVRELAQYGSSVGRLPEMVTGLSSGTITKVPVLREVAKPFARQFQTALDVAKVELWKAWREVTPKEEWSQVIQGIESQILTARMESAMVPHGRALLERVAVLAPSYYRGAVNFIGALGERGVTGKVARQAMGSFIAGSTALYVGVGLSLGMSMEEITKRLNPARGDFMMWPMEVAGEKLNIGFGGIFRSVLRLAGNAVKTSIENPGNWKSLSDEKNPMTRWYRGHAGPTVGMVWDQFTGRDYIGEKVNLETLPARVRPLWVQEAVESQGVPAKAAVTTGAQMLGLNTIPPVREGEPRFFVMKERIASRAGFEEYLNDVARAARKLSQDKQFDYVIERLREDEVAPRYREEAKRKLRYKLRQR